MTDVGGNSKGIKRLVWRRSAGGKLQSPHSSRTADSGDSRHGSCWPQRKPARRSLPRHAGGMEVSRRAQISHTPVRTRCARRSPGAAGPLRKCPIHPPGTASWGRLPQPGIPSNPQGWGMALSGWSPETVPRELATNTQSSSVQGASGAGSAGFAGAVEHAGDSLTTGSAACRWCRWWQQAGPAAGVVAATTSGAVFWGGVTDSGPAWTCR